MSTNGSAPDPVRCEALIVGGGMSGIGMAATLQREGIDDYVLIERSNGLGGTWHHNMYPGCGCDIPSALYSFAFRPNPRWSKMFADRDEIREYLLEVAEEYDVPRHARLNTEMTAARWDDERRLWQVETNQGRFETRWLLVGTGSLHDAKMAEIPGTEKFQGKLFHSSRWPTGYDGAGETVAVVGTGASSIQLTPALVETADQVVLFQRTPAYIQPRPNLPHGRFQQAMFRRFPVTQRMLRGVEWMFAELFLAGVTRIWLGDLLGLIPKAHLRMRVRDKELRRKLTPNYRMGCKRLLVANTFYPALTAPNFELVDSGVVQITENSLIAANGVERQVDSIVFATGFNYGVGPTARYIWGRGGRNLAEYWDSSPQAYLGTSVHGFPNMVLIWGPNTGTTSVAVSIEAQLMYVRAMLRTMRREGVDVLDVRKEPEDEFRDLVLQKTGGSVHTVGGCTSFYLDEKGKNLLLWPGTMTSMWRKMQHFDMAPYDPVPAPASPEPIGKSA